MKKMGLRSITIKKFNHAGNKKSDDTKEYPNLLEQDFFANKPSEKWVGDITYILDKKDELNLIERLDKFKENHLMFATNFSVDFTNNTSEKGLRQVNRKIAVSFMFKNSNRMKDYATILSYLETCYRNGISRYEASKRLVCGNPYTIDEITTLSDKDNNKK